MLQDFWTSCGMLQLWQGNCVSAQICPYVQDGTGVALQYVQAAIRCLVIVSCRLPTGCWQPQAIGSLRRERPPCCLGLPGACMHAGNHVAGPQF